MFVLFTDSYGLPILLKHIDKKLITGVVLSSIRSADNEKVNNEYSKEHTILIQPKFKDKIAYKKFLLKLKQKKS